MSIDFNLPADRNTLIDVLRRELASWQAGTNLELALAAAFAFHTVFILKYMVLPVFWDSEFPASLFDPGTLLGLLVLICGSGLLYRRWQVHNRRQLEYVITELVEAKLARKLCHLRHGEWIEVADRGLKLRKYQHFPDNRAHRHCLTRSYVAAAQAKSRGPFLQDTAAQNVAFWTWVSLGLLTVPFLIIGRDQQVYYEEPMGSLLMLDLGLSIAAITLLLILDSFARSRTYAVLAGLAMVLQEWEGLRLGSLASTDAVE